MLTDPEAVFRSLMSKEGTVEKMQLSPPLFITQILHFENEEKM